MEKIRMNKYRQGFTLIELVIVVAIIGILATMVVPKFTGVTDEARKQADLASARTIASAVSLAINEKGDVAQIGSEDVEKYLSNIEVNVRGESTDGWSVRFVDDGSKDFIILKDNKQIFPELEDTGS